MSECDEWLEASENTSYSIQVVSPYSLILSTIH